MTWSGAVSYTPGVPKGRCVFLPLYPHLCLPCFTQSQFPGFRSCSYLAHIFMSLSELPYFKQYQYPAFLWL